MAKYLVTGSAGFIAFRVIEQLLESGHQVVGVDNLNDAYDVRMKHYRLDQLQKKDGFVFHQIDISDNQSLQNGLSRDANQFAAVINLAARAGVRQSVQNPWVYVGTNTFGSLNLLELCRKYSIPKFILASTSSVYGVNAPLPTSETADSDHPLQPYAASKKGAEVLCHSYHYLYNIDISVVRYFTVYGPAGRPDMSMFRFCQWIFEQQTLKVNGNGEQSRGFTYVDDIAKGTILALKPLGYEIINLGGHETITINQLIHLFEKKIGQNATIDYGELHPADMLANWADISKARRLLDWKPEVTLDEGVSALVSWYRDQRSWASQIQTREEW